MAEAPRIVALITNAHAGAGFMLARQLLRKGGFHVIAAAPYWPKKAGNSRDVLQASYHEARKMPSRHLGGLDFVELDVGSRGSRFELQSSLASVLGREQKVNVLVNNYSAASVADDAIVGEMLPKGWDYVDPRYRNAVRNGAIANLRLAVELQGFYASNTQVINVSNPLFVDHLHPAYRRLLGSCQSVDELESKLAFSDESSSAMSEAAREAGDDPSGEHVPRARLLAEAVLVRGTELLSSKKGGIKGARVNGVDSQERRLALPPQAAAGAAAPDSASAASAEGQSSIDRTAQELQGPADSASSSSQAPADSSSEKTKKQRPSAPYVFCKLETTGLFATMVGDGGIVGSGNFYDQKGMKLRKPTWA